MFWVGHETKIFLFMNILFAYVTVRDRFALTLPEAFFFFFKRMGEILITVEANNLIWFKLVSVSFEKESIYIL